MSDSDLEKNLVDFLSTLVSRLPEGKTVSTPVVQQLLKTKHKNTYSEEFVNSHATFIATNLTRLLEEKQNKGKESESESDDEESESDSEEDEEEDDDDDEEDDDDDDEEDEDEESDEEPELKKAKLEVEEKLTSGDAVSARCKAMVNVLNKLHLRVRPPKPDEAIEQYLEYLKEEFVKQKLDPEKYSKSDIKRYQMQKEIEALQAASGVPLDLDRSQRVGRGLGKVPLKPTEGGKEKEKEKEKDDDWFLDN